MAGSSMQFLALQGGSGTAIPFARETEPSAIATVAMSPKDSQRLRRYEEHWRFYQGRHWNFDREDGEPLVTSNYCRAIVHKKAAWLVGKGMVLDTPQALQHVTKPKLVETWKYNNEQILLWKLAVTGGVTGDCVVLVTVKEPTGVERRFNPNTGGRIHLRLVMPHQYFPRYNPLNNEELIGVRIITEVDAPAPVERVGMRGTGRTVVPRKRRYVEDITAEKIVEGYEDGQMTEKPNVLGEIPVVHWVNLPFPGEVFGQSDLDGAIDLQRELNEKLTDLSDIINYHAAPITIVTGAKAKALEKDARNMWTGLPADAKVYNLELGSSGDTNYRYVELVRKMLLELASVPEVALGGIIAISNTAAAALEVQFQPLTEAIDQKRPNYEQGLERVNYLILRWWQTMEKFNLPVDLCKECGGRILTFQVKTKDGKQRTMRKCYLIDPQTLEFMEPDDVRVNVKREYSFGTETRMMPYGQVKKEFLQRSASYWDPMPRIDKVEEEQSKLDMAEQKKEEAAKEQIAAAGYDPEQLAAAEKPGEE